MKNLCIVFSLILSNVLFADSEIKNINLDTDSAISIESTENKEVDRLFFNFGLISVGAYRFQNFYLTNTGRVPLFFRSARLSGPGFFVRHNCGGVLPIRGQCNFTIEFSPFYEGMYSGQFMMSFDPGYSVIVNLQGQAFRY
jgi:hypothetical protein